MPDSDSIFSVSDPGCSKHWGAPASSGSEADLFDPSVFDGLDTARCSVHGRPIDRCVACQHAADAHAAGYAVAWSHERRGDYVAAGHAYRRADIAYLAHRRRETAAPAPRPSRPRVARRRAIRAATKVGASSDDGEPEATILVALRPGGDAEILVEIDGVIARLRGPVPITGEDFATVVDLAQRAARGDSRGLRWAS